MDTFSWFNVILHTQLHTAIARGAVLCACDMQPDNFRHTAHPFAAMLQKVNSKLSHWIFKTIWIFFKRSDSFSPQSLQAFAQVIEITEVAVIG